MEQRTVFLPPEQESASTLSVSTRESTTPPPATAIGTGTAAAAATSTLSAEARAEWHAFITKYQRGGFPRDRPPPIPHFVAGLLSEPSTNNNSQLMLGAAPSWLHNSNARPTTPEDLLEFYRIHRYLPSPVINEDQARRRNLIKRYGLDDSSRLASIDEIAELGRAFFPGITVIVTVVLEDVVLLLGQAAAESDHIDWASALRDLDQSLSLCRHGLLGSDKECEDDSFLILDARADWRVSENPVFTPSGGPIASYASSRIRLPLTAEDDPSSPFPSAHASIAVGNFCLLGTEPREVGSFTHQEHAVLRNLAQRVSRELQLGYQERRQARAQGQADLISSLLQKAQGEREVTTSASSRRNTRVSQRSSAQLAVLREQLRRGAGPDGTESSSEHDFFDEAVVKMCQHSSVDGGMLLDLREFVRSSRELSVANEQAKRPMLKRARSGNGSSSGGGDERRSSTDFSTRLLHPIDVLSSCNISTGSAEEGFERLNQPGTLAMFNLALQRWQQNPSNDSILSSALAGPLSAAAETLTVIPILDHARQLALLVVVSSKTAPPDLEVGDRTFLQNCGHVALTALIKTQAIEADQAKLAFVSQISHELRTPLHGLAGQLELIRTSTHVQGTSVFDSYLNIADSCIESLREITDDIVDFSRLAATSPAAAGVAVVSPDIESRDVCDLSALVREATKSAWTRKLRRESAQADVSTLSSMRDIEDTLDIIVDIGENEDGWLVDVVAGDWRRILSNILSNSFAYTSTGFVRVGLSRVSTAGGALACIRCQDTGVGMSSEFLQNHLYRPFRQGDSFTPGSGLGMPIVRALVERMGGTIQVDSVEAVGTTVTVTLPVTSVPSGPCEAISISLASELHELRRALSPVAFGYFTRSPNASHRSPQRRLSVAVGPDDTPNMMGSGSSSASEEPLLTPSSTASYNMSSSFAMATKSQNGIVPVVPIKPMPSSKPTKALPRRLNVFAAEDNPISRNILSVMFSRKGYEFHAVHDGQQAVDFFKQGNFRPDVTLMDIQMPRKDGLAASFEMREHEMEMGWSRHKIIALTGLSNSEDMAKGLESGGPLDGWICKGGSALKQLSEELEVMAMEIERENDGSA